MYVEAYIRLCGGALMYVYVEAYMRLRAIGPRGRDYHPN